MPKDATKNVDRYKVQGGHLNEYEFEQGKAADKKQTATDDQQTGMPKDKVDKSRPARNPKH